VEQIKQNGIGYLSLTFKFKGYCRFWLGICI